MAVPRRSLFARYRLGAWICAGLLGWVAVFGAQAQAGFETTQRWSAAVPGFTPPPGGSRGLGVSLAVGDFNGDHFQDLAMGEPDGPMTPIVFHGFVHLLAGGIQGLSLPNRLLSQQVPGSPDPAETEDQFGEVMAAGDFNGDGVDDLAVGLPLEDVGSLVDAGAVQVFWGVFGQGLLASPSQLFTQNSPGFSGASEASDRLGRSLAAGDFNLDGFDDLAVGADGENNFAGQVQILYGSTFGLSTSGMQSFDQNSGSGWPLVPMLDVAEALDLFGSSLAAGDFNGDLVADLAIGVRGEDAGAGGVAVLRGSTAGLTLTGNQFWRPNSFGLVAPTVGGNFGYALAAGDFDDNGRDDLAIGAPDAAVANAVGTVFGGAGSVRVLRGSASGLSSAGNQVFTQESPGFPAYAEAGVRLGHSLASGDFNDDGFADLAIGAPRETVGSVEREGSAFLIFGSASSLNTLGARQWSLANISLGGNARYGDEVGWALAAGDFDADGHGDLVMGAPGNAIGNLLGAVAVVYEPAPLSSPPPIFFQP